MRTDSFQFSLKRLMALTACIAVFAFGFRFYRNNAYYERDTNSVLAEIGGNPWWNTGPYKVRKRIWNFFRYQTITKLGLVSFVEPALTPDEWKKLSCIKHDFILHIDGELDSNSLVELSRIRSLGHLTLNDSKLPRETIDKFRRTRPDVSVQFDDEYFPK